MYFMMMIICEIIIIIHYLRISIFVNDCCKIRLVSYYHKRNMVNIWQQKAARSKFSKLFNLYYSKTKERKNIRQ